MKKSIIALDPRYCVERTLRLRRDSVVFREWGEQVGVRSVTCFHKSEIGFSHLRDAKVCQDYSDEYRAEGRVIVSACDGHGGKIYIRSDRGSRFASEAAIECLRALALEGGEPLTEQERDHLKLEILCAWNRRVEKDLETDPISAEEIAQLSPEQRFRLFSDPTVAYGTTMHAVMLWKGRVIYAGIGDGGAFLYRRGALSPLGEEDDNVANVTESLCQQDAFNHLQAGEIRVGESVGLIVCTDGTINPYRNLDNFRRAFVAPVLEKLGEGKAEEVEAFMTALGRSVGIGDDVSVGVILSRVPSPYAHIKRLRVGSQTRRKG